MRLRSDIFVSALTRRVFRARRFRRRGSQGRGGGGRGLPAAGFRDGTESLFAPAPQSFFDADDSNHARLFEARMERTDAGAVTEAIARERRFDPDLWVVSIETDDLGDLIDFAGGKQAVAVSAGKLRLLPLYPPQPCLPTSSSSGLTGSTSQVRACRSDGSSGQARG